jgi:hypothetical protein
MCIRFPFDDFGSFNSPFEVLFNFPSQYLFAIDLQLIFNRRWRIPPIHTLLSKNVTPATNETTLSVLIYGTITLYGCIFQYNSTNT